MKIFNGLLLLVCGILIFGSCSTGDSEESKLADLEASLKVDPNAYVDESKDTPGVIPSGHPVYTRMSNVENPYSWDDNYSYLKDGLRNEIEKHYFSNIQWMAILSVLRHPDFYSEASLDIKENMWIIMKERRVINEPEDAIILLKSMKSNLSTDEYAVRLQHIIDINKQNYSNNTTGYKSHFESHKSAYAEINNELKLARE